jgi:hypothetical protein
MTYATTSACQPSYWLTITAMKTIFLFSLIRHRFKHPFGSLLCLAEEYIRPAARRTVQNVSAKMSRFSNFSISKTAFAKKKMVVRKNFRTAYTQRRISL